MSKLDRVFKNSKTLNIDDEAKIVIMSDCHRGIGNNYDNFLKNKNIYKAALYHYYHKGFTYIELGDGDEMWEVKNYDEIVNEYFDVFRILRKFHLKKRLIMVYGNHDMIKKNHKILEKHFYKYYNKKLKKEEDLLVGLKVYESLVLNYKNNQIFMLHGHQVDFFNSNLWRLSCFLVRYVWKNLEWISTKDLTNSAKNYKISKKTERKLKKWSLQKHIIVVAGHTHRPVFPKEKESLYFNDGCCIHPDGITCLEIENGNITLVKWEFSLKDEKYLSASRIVLEESIALGEFF